MACEIRLDVDLNRYKYLLCMKNGRWDQWRHFDSLFILFLGSYSFFLYMVNYVSLFSFEDNMLSGS
jgi:hypothetical protein